MKKFILILIYSVVLRWFLRLIVGISFSKGDFLKDLDQFIIVANHNSHLDTMTIMSSIPSSIIHKVKPVAAKDHFGKSKLSTAFTQTFINALLIKRGRDKDNPENDPIFQMTDALDKGYSLILFPEGTRGEPEVEQPLKAGVALVLNQRPDVHLVPAYMTGMGKAMPKGDGLIIPFNSRLLYGQPQKIESTEVDEILEQISANFEQLKVQIDGSNKSKKER